MWTPLTKPNSSSWTPVNTLGKTQYDQGDVFYDDPNVFYDGYNPTAWTDLAKPTTSSWTPVNKPV